MTTEDVLTKIGPIIDAELTIATHATETALRDAARQAARADAAEARVAELVAKYETPAEREVWRLNPDTIAKNARMIIASTSDGRALRHLMPKGKWGGATAQTMWLPETLTQAKFTYRVRLRTGDGSPWPWAPWGFKLPGLCGVAPGHSLAEPSGGHWAGDVGWAGRIMARQNAQALSYMYGPLQSLRTKPDGAQYGDDLYWADQAPVLTADRVMTIEHEYVMNDPAKTGAATNGRLIARIDSTVVLDRPYTYRTRSDVGINGIQWSVFAGGASVSWAAPVDRYVDVLDAVVATTDKKVA